MCLHTFHSWLSSSVDWHRGISATKLWMQGVIWAIEVRNTRIARPQSNQVRTWYTYPCWSFDCKSTFSTFFCLVGPTFNLFAPCIWHTKDTTKWGFIWSEFFFSFFPNWIHASYPCLLPALVSALLDLIRQHPFCYLPPFSITVSYTRSKIYEKTELRSHRNKAIPRLPNKRRVIFSEM